MDRRAGHTVWIAPRNHNANHVEHVPHDPGTILLSGLMWNALAAELRIVDIHYCLLLPLQPHYSVYMKSAL